MATHCVTPLLHPLDAVVAVPGSKSIANRALVCAALAEGTSTLGNLPDGDDTRAMLTCLETLGIGIARTAVTPGLTGAAVTTITGAAGVLRPGPPICTPASPAPRLASSRPLPHSDQGRT